MVAIKKLIPIPMPTALTSNASLCKQYLSILNNLTSYWLFIITSFPSVCLHSKHTQHHQLFCRYSTKWFYSLEEKGKGRTVQSQKRDYRTSALCKIVLSICSAKTYFWAESWIYWNITWTVEISAVHHVYVWTVSSLPHCILT